MHIATVVKDIENFLIIAERICRIKGDDGTFDLTGKCRCRIAK